MRRFAADKAESLADGFWSRIYWPFRVRATIEGGTPETLSLGWLPAVRFIPAERVSGVPPSMVDMRSPLCAL